MNIVDRYEALSSEYIRAAVRRNLSPQSLRNYRSRLNSFGTFLKDRYCTGSDREYVGFDDVTAYIDSLIEKGSSPATVKQYLIELGQFFSYAAKPYIPEDLRYSSSPVSQDFFPKTPSKPIEEILPDRAVSLLWENACRYKNGPRGLFPRNYAITVLILSTGLRNKEVLDLTAADVDFQNREITIRHGKGDKYRVVDAPVIALTAISLYLQAGIRPDGISLDAPLFGTYATHEKGASRYGEIWHRGSSQWLSELIERHVYNQTGYHDVRSHDLRHLYARTNLNAGASMELLQSELGHSALSTTQIYSGRLLQRRRRESAQAVLAARDAAAKLNESLLRTAEQVRERWA